MHQTVMLRAVNCWGLEDRRNTYTTTTVKGKDNYNSYREGLWKCLQMERWSVLGSM